MAIRAYREFDRRGGEQAPDSVIYGLLKILFATKISLCREHRFVSQQELDLFYFAAGSMAQLCTGSSQIVGSEMV